MEVLVIGFHFTSALIHRENNIRKVFQCTNNNKTVQLTDEGVLQFSNRCFV